MRGPSSIWSKPSPLFQFHKNPPDVSHLDGNSQFVFVYCYKIIIYLLYKMRAEIIISLLSFISSAFAIDCYQCKSTDLTNPYQCNEFMEDSDLKPSPCDSVYNAAYCIKQTGRFEGGLGTKRFCSSLDLGNYCNFIQQPGDPFEYRSCVYTCDSDGCNSASYVSICIHNMMLFLISSYSLNIFLNV